MKKLLSLLLAIMMIVSCVPAMADAEWKINATTQLVSRKSAAEKLDSIVVPAEVDGVAVRGVEYMAFNMYKNFKSLAIADSAVMLDRGVLRDLPKLETVDLSENLLVIREGNFTNLPMLTSVVVPASVAVVHSSFSNCKSLTSITFEGMCPVFASAGTYDLFADLPADCVIYVPNNQVHVYKAAFADREDVAARIQPSGKNAIAVDRTVPETDFVFDAATGTITGYTGTASYLLIPATIDGVQVKHIAADAFLQCHSLCCVVVPEGVETVGDWAFAGIALLSYVSLPSTLVSLGNEAFSSNKTYMSAIAFNGSAVPTFSADAFAGFKGDWHVILPYGSDQAYVDAFAAYIAPSADTAVVGASLIDPNAFPTLDAEAAAAFTGTWNGVAVFDGTDTYGMDLLGLTVTVVLNDDGTGSLTMDGDAASGRWYVDGGAAVFAPIYEEGGKPALEEAIPMPLDENNRMVIDLGGLYLMMELEGATYATSVFPAASSGSSVEGAEMLLGDWYDDVGNKLTLTEDGVMTFTWAFDGWVDEYTWAVVDGAAVVTSGSWNGLPITLENGILMITNGEGIFQIFSVDGDLSAYYGDDDDDFDMPVAQPIGDEGAAYFGTWIGEMYGMPVYLTLNQDGTCAIEMFGEVEPGVWSMMGDKAYVMGDELYIDGNGSLVMPSAEVSFTKAGGAAPAPAPAGIPHIEATADDYIGGWICVEMPSMQLLLLDGEANMIDGTELYTTTWEVVDGVAEFDGMKLYTQEDWSGILDMGDGTLLTFERGYVEKPEASTNEPDDSEYAAMPVGPEGEPFFGVWNLESMAGMNPADFGMSMTLTFNEDGTCVLFDGYEGETGFWWVSDGAAVVMGDALTLNDEGKLVMSADGMDMIFAKEGEEPAAPADPEPAADSSAYLGYWKLETMMGMDAALMGVSMTLTLNEDGTCTLETDGEVSDGIWSMEGDKAVIDGEYLTLTADGKLDMSDGMMIFVKSETAHETAVPTEAPTADPANNNAAYIGKKFVCTTYTTAGYTMDASMLGAEYSVLFKADHTCDFTMAGFTLNSLPYTVTAEGVYAINYYGSMFNCVPTSTGFDMDYYGTMLMHFVPAE